MTFSRTTRLFYTAPMVALLAACGGAADGGEGGEGGHDFPADAPAELKERHDNFEAIGDSFKAIRAEFEGDSPDLAKVEAEARNINERANAIEDHFPEGSGPDAGWDTEALPTIWEKPAEFTAAQQKLLEESATMMRLAGEGDAAAAGEQVGALGGACKNCHDTFRQKKD